MSLESFEARLAGELKNRSFAGAAWAVTDGKQLLSARGFGVASAEEPQSAVRPDTIFRIASNTKIIVTLIAMQLRRKGLLDLDAPVGTYIPQLPLADGQPTERITMRRLLSHTAGFPVEYTPDGCRDEDRCEEVLMRELEGLRLLSDPDEGQYLYSNVGVRLAAVILSRITGKRFSALAAEYVLEPLGMEHSTFDLNAACTYSLALPHSAGPRTEHYIPVNAARYAAGGLFSCAEDMAKLARLFLNRGAPLVSEADWDEIVSPMAEMEPEKNGHYCLTMMKRRFCGIVLTGHTGSAPPYRSCIWVWPEKDLGVCFAANTEGGDVFTNEIVPELFISELG